MSFSAERQAIETRFETNWGSTTPISWDNVEYTPVAGTSFVELIILSGTSIPASLGDNPLHRNDGIININIYTPLGQGTDQGRQYADTAAAIFRGVQFNGITCRSPSVVRIGETNGWFQYNVSCPYFRDTSFN